MQLNKKHDGHGDKSIAALKRGLMSLIDKSLKLPHSIALDDMRILFKDEASEYHEAKLKDKAASIEQAFAELEDAFCASAITEATKEEWDDLKLESFRAPGKSDKKALGLLIKRGRALQKQIPRMHRPDPLFKDMLKKATKKESFLRFFTSSVASKASQQHASQLKLAIRRNENRSNFKEKDDTAESINGAQARATTAFASEFFTKSFNPAKRSRNGNFDRRHQNSQSKSSESSKKHHHLSGIDKKKGDGELALDAELRII